MNPRGGVGLSFAGLVDPGGVEGELAEVLAGLGVDDADVAVGDEHDDGGAFVGSADADPAEPGLTASSLWVSDQ